MTLAGTIIVALFVVSVSFFAFGLILYVIDRRRGHGDEK